MPSGLRVAFLAINNILFIHGAEVSHLRRELSFHHAFLPIFDTDGVIKQVKYA